MIDHEYIRQLMSVDLDGEATSSEKELIEEHLKRCEACRQYSQELQRLSSVLHKWSDETLSPDLEQKITQRLTTSQDSKEGTMDRKELISIGVKSGAVVFALVMMLFSVQLYVNRGLQGRLKSSADDIGEQYSSVNGPVLQAKIRDSELASRSSSAGAPVVSATRTQSKTNDTFISAETLAFKKEDGYLQARGYTSPPSSTDKLASLEKDKQSEPYYLSTNYEETVDSAVNRQGGGEKGKFKNIYPSASVAAAVEMPALRAERRSDLALADSKQLYANKAAPTEPMSRARAIGGFQAQAYNGVRENESTNRTLNSNIMNTQQEFWGRDEQREGTEYYRYPVIPSAPTPPINTEEYDQIYENPFSDVRDSPLSTFSIDVDKASYANIRRFINSNQLPPRDAVRIEEMINYFHYDYPQPGPWGAPFTITSEVARCPWNPQHHLVMIGLQAKKIQSERLPPSNLVFLIDVSGSMADTNKLPLLKSVFRTMVEKLRPEDRISIVVYAGQAGLVLESTPGNYKERILSAIENLQAGGSTAGGEGIMLAYRIARDNFIRNGNNRVILATDGDFNVGVSSDDELTRLIEEKRDEGIFLTVLGVGTGNYKDSKMEKLADKGNGNYAYLDNVVEGEKVLVNEMSATLLTVAKDVKIQVEFNPSQVKAYKLIGYENRMLAKEDFNDDRKDAGEIGAGHSVTAFYEIVTTDRPDEQPYGYRPVVDPLKYQADDNSWQSPSRIKPSSDLMTIKLRYKEPNEDESKLVTKVLTRWDLHAEPRSENFKFASAVAEFGLLLRDSQDQHRASFDHVIKLAQESIGKDPDGYRSEFLRIVKMAQFLKERR